MGEPSVTTETYESLRPLAFSIAYRMLGSVSEAEDVVQEGLLRLHRADDVEHPKAFVATVVTRLSIDELRSARSRRETYVGPWLPEPLLTDSRPDDESVSMALLVTLEALTPVERAVFLLHDVFDYGYDEIAEIVGKTRENCRQLAAPRAPPRRGPAAALRALARAARGARRALLRGDPRGRPRRAREPARRGRRRDRRRRRQGGGAQDPAARRREDRALHARPDAARRARRLRVRLPRGQRRGRAR